ncbi:MAG: hypothetical protein COA33_007710 [Fluviicola sp.]|nr:hypothetical protein [Fluviicola sp.]
MKIITTSILILFCVTYSFAQNDTIEKVFTKFQTALLKEDCKKLVAVSSFPIEGDMGLARLVTSDPPRIDMKKHNYEISKELLMQKCTLLDSIELKVLKQFSLINKSKNSGIEYKGCIYKAHLFIAEDNSYFQWSVGCVELLEDPIGEYSMIFTFKLIDGAYKLKQIHGAG